MNEENEFVKGNPDQGPQHQPPPIEPGRSLPEGDAGERPADLRRNHAELVLFLGIVSLFMCGPVGIVAWILGSSDLKKIRREEMSPAKIGILRLGRVLGLVGTVLFGVAIVLAVFLFSRGITTLGDVIKTGPLPPDQIVFAGEWIGNQGTVIRIHPDGTADFRSRHSSMVGGHVKIQGDALAIGFMAFTSTWHIDKRPFLQDGTWTMILDGERFTRNSDGELVHRLNSPTRIQWTCRASYTYSAE